MNGTHRIAAVERVATARYGLCAASALLIACGVVQAQTIRQDFYATDGVVSAEALVGSTLYIGGSFTRVGLPSGGAVPLDAVTGVPAPGFPKVGGIVSAIVSDGSGGWFIGGLFASVGGVPRNNLAHVLSDNTVAAWDPNTGANIPSNAQVYTLAVSGSTVYAGGNFTTINGGTPRIHLAALDAATGIATAWDPNLSDDPFALAVSGNTVYVGGAFTTVNGGTTRNHLAALDAATGVATVWDPNVSGQVNALAVAGGTVYAGGFFTAVNGGTPRNRLAAFDATTGIASAWDPNTNNGYVGSLAKDGNTVYAGGDFTTINGGTSRNHLAAIDAATGIATAWDPNLNSDAGVLAVSGNTVYVGGFFTTVNRGTPRNHLAALDATTGVAAAWNPNADDLVSALAVSGGTVYAGGRFNFLGGAATQRNRLAAIDTATGIVTAWDPNVNGSVNALAVSGGTVYAGGTFATVNGATTRNRLAAFDAATGVATAWDPNANGIVSSLAISGGTVFVGGKFTAVNGGGTTRNHLAALDATTGIATAWNPNTNIVAGPPGVGVIALAPSGGVVYAGGDFTTVNGGTTRNRLAAFDATTGIATAWDPNANAVVRALLVSGGTVYAGGSFTTVNGGTTRNRLVSIDAATGIATAWDPNAGGQVNVLALGGGTVYAGGSFTTINGGTPRSSLGALDVTTGLATSWNPNANSAVSALAVGGGSVYVGGGFTAIGLTAQSHLAAIDATPPFTIVASAGANGSISPNGAVPVVSGASQTFTIIPNSCYSVADVLVDGVSVGAVTGYTFTAVASDHTISATFTPAPGGTACGDGNACTTGDTCSAGSCVGGAPSVCDDANVCTDDTCNPVTGCVFTNNTASCSDGNPCTTGDTCGGGSCQPGAPLVCNDNNPCTLDSCSPGTGCVFTGGDCVVAVDPPANTTEVQVSTSVTLTYYDPIDPVTVTSSTFRLVGPGEVAVPATYSVSIDAKRPTLNPTQALAAQTTYRVETTSGVLGPGSTATQPFTSYFRTGDAGGSSEIPDISEPTSALPTSAQGGSSIARGGDLNGDGTDDVLMGAPGYTDPGNGVPAEAGAALVYLGSASSAERTVPDIIFTGASAHDRAGVSLAGDFDFNGDGLRDIVIGAEQVDRTGATATPTGNGKVYLIFFDPADTVHYPNIGNPAVPDTLSLSLVGQPGGIPGVVFTGVNFGDQAGFSVAGGGTSTPGGGKDIVIGAPGADPGALGEAGAAYVVFDSQTLSGDVSLTRISDGLPDQVPGKEYLGAEAGGNLGYSTAFGGDIVQGETPGAGTIILGAPNTGSGRGVTICPPGDPDTTPIIVDAVGNGHTGFQITGSQPGEQLGFAVSSGGDAIADGIPDLLIGAPTYDVVGTFTTQADAGRALQTSQVIPSGVYSADAVGTTIQGVIWTGESSGDQLGAAVASVHDVTGDGFDDIVLGAPFVDPLVGGIPQPDAGAVYLIAGSPSNGNLGTISVAQVGETVPGQQINGTEPGEHAGSSVTGTGDISGDGHDDFAVGAPDSDSQAGTVDLVLHNTPPPVGNCGPAGCVVADLLTGAEIDIQAGALAAPVDVTVQGITDPSGLPAPAPAGKMLLAAARFTPDGQAVSSPFATVYVPIVPAATGQSPLGEILPLFYYNGSAWTAVGVNGTTAANPSYPSRRASSATISVLRVYAVFVNDGDGDAVRDGVDNCPAIANPSQTDTDHDGIGDACECVNVDCNDSNACTDDGCDPASGCVHANNSVACTDDTNVCTDDVCAGGACTHPNNSAACDDGNFCTSGDFCAGGSCTPGTPVPPPGEIVNAHFTDKVTFVWDSIPNSPHYDTVRGLLSALPVGPGGGDEFCFDEQLSSVLVDATAPPGSGTGFWYVTRGETACGIGTWGTRHNGTPRITTTCP